MSTMSLLPLVAFLLLLQTYVVTANSHSAPGAEGETTEAFGFKSILQDTTSRQNRNVLEAPQLTPTAYCGFKNDEHPWRVNSAGSFNVCALTALNSQACDESYYVNFASRCFWSNDSCHSSAQYGGSQCYHDTIQNQQDCEESPAFQGIDYCDWKEPEEETQIAFSSYCGFPNSVNPWSLPLNVCAVDAYTGNYKEQCETSNSYEFLTCTWNDGSCHGDANTCRAVSNADTCESTSYLQFGLCKWYTPPTSSPTAAPSVSMSPTSSVVPSASLLPSMSVSPSTSMMPSLSTAPSVFGSTGPSSSLVPSGAPSLARSASPSSLPTLAPSHTEVLEVRTPVPLTASPTPGPTRHPTASPTPDPTPGPTVVPSWAPSILPTVVPSVSPTDLPSLIPTVLPSASPTSSPTLFPSTSFPSITPTDTPTDLPTNYPTRNPSAFPSSSPTAAPSAGPTFAPTVPFTNLPTNVPESDDDNGAGGDGLATILVAGGLLAAISAACACVWKCCCCCCRKKEEPPMKDVDPKDAAALADKQLVAAEMGEQKESRQ